MMANTIATGREEKNRRDKTKGIRLILGAKAFPAEKPPKKGLTLHLCLPNPIAAQDIGLYNQYEDQSRSSQTPINPQKGGKGKEKGGKGKYKTTRGSSVDSAESANQDLSLKMRPCVYRLFTTSRKWDVQGVKERNDIRTGREEKIKNWTEGFGPEITGGGYGPSTASIQKLLNPMICPTSKAWIGIPCKPESIFSCGKWEHNHSSFWSSETDPYEMGILQVEI